MNNTQVVRNSNKGEKLSRKMQEIRDAFDIGQTYQIAAALQLLIDNSKRNFDETVEVALRFKVDTKKQQLSVYRGMAVMPNGIGKHVRIAIICENNKLSLAQSTGAEFVGEHDLIAKIAEGFTDFDVCICDPVLMKDLSKVAAILGPKGLMPNPKLGTVTSDFKEAVTMVRSGKPYKMDKYGVVHAGVGKLSFGVKKLIENIAAITSAVLKHCVKGTSITSAHITATMSPGIKIAISDVYTVSRM